MTYNFCRCNNFTLRGYENDYFIEKPNKPYQRTDRSSDIKYVLAHFLTTSNLMRVTDWDVNDRLSPIEYDILCKFETIDDLRNQLPELFL